MSFVVLAIGAAHALPPILGAMMGRSKRGVWIGAGIAVLLGLVSGNPAYIAVDLIGVGLGVWIGLSVLNAQRSQ